MLIRNLHEPSSLEQSYVSNLPAEMFQILRLDPHFVCFVLLQTILIHTIWVIWWLIDSIITPRKCINCQRIVSKENRALPMRHYCWDYSRVLVQGVRVHEDVKRCHQRVKCLELGDWLEVGLGTETGGFPPWFSHNLRFNHQKVQRLGFDETSLTNDSQWSVGAVPKTLLGWFDWFVESVSQADFC